MLAIEVNVSVFVLFGMLAIAFIIGFLLRGQQLNKCRRKITELERELLRSDASILEMEKEKLALLRQMKESKIPVIPMKKTNNDDDKSDQSRRAN